MSYGLFFGISLVPVICLIYIACVYLTFIEKLPMHPQTATGWVERDQAFFCPAYSGKDSVCECCVCGK